MLKKQASPVRRGEKRKLQTRSAILDAGQRLFSTRALDSVSVDDIVMEADVAKGSFYNHFDDKEGLAKAIVELVQGDCEYHIYSANRDMPDPPTRVVRAVCVAMRYAVDHPERLRALLSLTERRTVAGTPLNTGLTADLSAGLNQTRFVGITVEAGILIVIGIIHSATTHITSGESDTPPADIAATVGAAMLRALGLENDEATLLARTSADEILTPGSVK